MVLVIKNLIANAGDVRDMGSIPGSGRSLEEGNGNLLKYSCLENSMDRGHWWAMVHKVTKSWTQLRRLNTQRDQECVCINPNFLGHPSPTFPTCAMFCVCVCVKNDAVMMNWGRIPTEQGLWHFYKVGPWDPRNGPFSPRTSYKLLYCTYCA